MKILIQRVKRASVVSGKKRRKTGPGLLCLVAVAKDDREIETKFVAEKTANLRIFDDNKGKFNFSLMDTKGEVLAVPQFTLYGDCRRGRRPGFERSAGKDKALKFFNLYTRKLRSMGIKVKEGFFGRHMELEIINDGPVTLILDS